MKTKIKNNLKLKTLGFLLLIPLLSIASPKYYGKHIVLVVDQTPKTSAGGYLQPLGEDIKSFLFGTKSGSCKYGPDSFRFNPETDFLEVFTYGLQGNVATGNSGDAYSLSRESIEEIGNDTLFQHTLKYLVHPYENFTGAGNFEQTWDNVFKNVFDTSKTSLGKSIKANSGYGLPAFLPYAVLPFIDRSIPAQEYYIVSVSTFQTGTTGKIAKYDIEVLSQIYKSKVKATEFDKWINNFAKPYQVSDWANFSLGDVNNGVSAIGNQLVLRSAVNTSVYITSNLSLSQKSYMGKSYEINKVAISFPKDKDLDISDINLTVSAGDKIIFDANQKFTYDESRKEFIIDAQVLDLENFSKDDILSFNFTFFPKSNGNGNANVLPYVFLADRTLPANEIAYKRAPTYLYIIILCALVILSLICYYIYKKRGERATTEINLNIWPISNSRFMDVSNNHVINQDCWYYQDGKKTKNIEVSGSVKSIYPTNAKKYKLVAEYQIQDVDLNEEFSFRPDGRETNGSFRSAKVWYPLALDNDGNFAFEVTAYLEDAITVPDFSNLSHCILKLSVLVRTHFVDKNGKQITPYNQIEDKYRFIVRPAIENSDLWVALDPGTTGSCIAYGWGGLPADTNNINLACSMSTDTAGNQHLSHIFHSKVQILDHASIFDGASPVEMCVFDSESGKGDFRFGNEAHIFWGRNSFQSIKKLLGYANELEVKNDKGKVAKISGHDLAHLLIKGLCREFEKFLGNSESVKDNVKQKLLTNGHLSPSRAIVAVPNNYTVNKVQAMVDTIKRTNLFKEVHYVYEAEGVMMYYLNLNWSNLVKVANKTFIVFDMGGATINATAFNISVTTGTQSGSIYTRSISVDTVSRVGYTVGGDNIDFALINIIIGIPSFLTALNNIGKSTDDFLKENKKRLISFVQKLKLDYIEKITSKSSNLREGNIAQSEESFWTELFKFAVDCKLSIPDSITEEDKSYLKGEIAANIMDTLVMTSVRDAIKELVSDLRINDVELILSGRSVLYPRIKKMVVDTLLSSKCQVSEWSYNGSKENSDEAVKTAVVRGACWYGMFSKYVRLRHDTVTSTFGYTDMVNQRIKFIPVISKNTKFNENGEAENIVKPMDPTINTVKFIQMLGAEYDAIYNNPEALHKMAELTQVSSADIRGTVRTIKIKVDANGNFSYEISVTGETEPLTGTCNTVDADITDTNSDAYSFAALSTLDDKYDNFTNNVPEQSPKVNNTFKSSKRRF